MRRLKPKVKIALIIVSAILLFVILCISIYKIGTGKVSKDETLKEIEVTSGNTYMSVSKILKDNNLIKSEFFFKVYVKLHKQTSLQAGKYELSENMSVKEIISVLSNGSTYNPNVVSLTFKEGINMRNVAKIIAENTENTEEDVFVTLSDTNYLDELIKKYWFVTEEVKNKNIYYSLEGYLFPNTYSVNKTDSVKKIFEMMLDNMSLKLSPYKEQIQSSTHNVHEILTLASIIELEAGNSNDRSGVAGVFYNRLKSGWSLGSDVTTYYGAKIELHERDLYQREIDEYNVYNTRSSQMAGRLPVGPICLPSLDSISAAVNPTVSEYYYFVADKNKKTYFSKTYEEHAQTVASLKSQGLWYEY